MRCERMVGTEKRRRLVDVTLNAIDYKHGAWGEITYFYTGTTRNTASDQITDPRLIVVEQ